MLLDALYLWFDKSILPNPGGYHHQPRIFWDAVRLFTSTDAQYQKRILSKKKNGEKAQLDGLRNN